MMLSLPCEFSKYLIDKAYAWCINLKPGKVHDWEHLIADDNLTRTEIGKLDNTQRET